MNCKICGAELNADDMVCASCGSPVEKQGEDSVTEESIVAGESTVTEDIVTGENAVTEQNIVTEEKADSVMLAQAGLEKPKHDKAPLIVIGVIIAAIAAALVFLVINLTGVGNPQAQVKKAFLNTYKELSDRDGYEKTADALMEGLFSENFKITVDEINMAEDSLMIPMPIRFSMDAIMDGENGEMAVEMAAGLSDMRDIRLDMFIGKDGYLFGVPDLYDKYIRIDMEDVTDALGVELDMEAQMNTEAARKAGRELEKVFVKWLSSAYSSVVCEKTEQVTLNTGDREINAQEYVLKMSRDDFERCMRMLPQMLEENTIVMEWLASITSEQETEDFIDALWTLAEELIPKTGVQEIILGYVDVSGSKAVQVRMPLGEVEETSEMLVVSFFGKENIADDIRIDVTVYAENDAISANYTMCREGSVDAIQLSLAENETAVFTLSMEGECTVSDEACSYEIRNARLTVGEGDTADVSCSFSMSYGLEKAASIEKPDWDSALDAMNMSEDESLEVVITILGNAIDGGYIPSEYVETVGAMMQEFGTENSSDDGAGMLDGSEALTYEEYAAMVKEAYGDLFSEEDLKTLYESTYGESYRSDDGGFDYNDDIVYGSSGLPYLLCMDEDLMIELQPVDGFEFSADYSNAYTLEYEKDSEDDLIVMSYSITTDPMDEYMEWEAEFQKEYYDEVGCTLEMSEIQTGIINAHKTSWFEYLAEDDMGNKSQGIIAYAELDEEHGCVLDMYSIFGIEEVTEDLLYECFDLYYIEN